MRRIAWIMAVAICGVAAGAGKPPKGAVVLFDGKDVSQWDNGKAVDGELQAGAVTKETFQDFQLHVEFKIVVNPELERRQQQGNSGIYLQKRYEIQILDSFGKEKPGKQDCGAIYSFKAPDVNASKKAGEWQTFDITFRAARYKDGQKTESARITVLQNGVKVQDNVEVPNKTGHGQPEGPEAGPILLQEHGNPVVFRNVWVIPAKEDGVRS